MSELIKYGIGYLEEKRVHDCTPGIINRKHVELDHLFSFFKLSRGLHATYEKLTKNFDIQNQLGPASTFQSLKFIILSIFSFAKQDLSKISVNSGVVLHATYKKLTKKYDI